VCVLLAVVRATSTLARTTTHTLAKKGTYELAKKTRKVVSIDGFECTSRDVLDDEVSLMKGVTH
jgi:hypothetical protein